ncbi:hypothetical protein SAMN05920897_1303 [Alkalispirochaeta americana]|uniref:Capsule polysaccharide biosynthesis protein n=1 Tax=Alkalispirochaeta americana TaxID=159291 RepID=A0A1N6XS50_9SPIO|nr:hypothetical protein [Alkalispirochaeta americana]SIR05153.1 hypothetical protein SAMN05920897_1303 [Alkalispirochaeta americana]
MANNQKRVGDGIELYEEFIKIEDSFGLLRPGDPLSDIWERLRYSVFSELRARQVQLKVEDAHQFPIASKTRSSWFIRLCVIVREVCNLYIFGNPIWAIFRRRKYAFWGHPRRKLEKDGLYWDIYTDLIIDRLGQDNCVSIERDWHGRHLTPAVTQNLFYQDSLDLIVGLLRRIRKPRLSDQQRRKLGQLAIALRESFGTDCSIRKRGARVHGQAVTQTVIFRLFLQLLQPKVVFLVTSNVHCSLIEAAKELGIPTVELQHAIVSRYYVVLSYEGDRQKRSGPDYFFCFGDLWKDAAQFSIPEDHIVPVGFPFLSDRLNQYQPFQKQELIVFLASKTLDDTLARMAAGFSEKYAGRIKVVYKLHPETRSMWRSLYPQLASAAENNHVTVVDGQTPTLYELLAQARWQVGIASTALLEGAAFGCTTFVLNAPGVETMSFLLECGMACLVNSEEDIDLTFSTRYMLNDVFADEWYDKIKRATEFVERKHKQV